MVNRRGQVTVIPAALIAWRKERSLTQAALAGRAGVSHSLVEHAERGRRNLSLASAEAIAGVLEVPVSAIARVNEEVIV